MIRSFRNLFLAAGVLLGTASISSATILGFGQLGGGNATVPGDYGSNATAAASGLVVTNGTTPNISLTWQSNWDIHTSDHFAEIENQTVGGGDWDNEGPDERVGQLDDDNHTVGFAADAGYAVVINSFDFGNTEETADVSVWDLTITDSLSTPVWSQQVTLDNAGVDVVTVTPNFTGLNGASYTLSFDGVSGGDGDGSPRNGRHAIDNFSFNQVSVPEPTSIALVGLSILGLAACRRRSSK